MISVMVKESDLNRIDVAEGYEVLDATALGRRLGFRRDTVLAYLCDFALIGADLSNTLKYKLALDVFPHTLR
jgi:hypothetical protein